jgi:hypothetical protein
MPSDLQQILASTRYSSIKARVRRKSLHSSDSLVPYQNIESIYLRAINLKGECEGKVLNDLFLALPTDDVDQQERTNVQQARSPKTHG